MLDRAHRLTTAEQYRSTLRRGRRRGGRLLQVSTVHEQHTGSPRFGFVVSRRVGGAVVRNRVRRRLKAIAYDLASTVQPGTSVVVRALPAAATAGFEQLADEFRASL